jgi:hypothetical protein
METDNDINAASPVTPVLSDTDSREASPSAPLSYAPQLRAVPQPWLLICCGLASSALAMAAVFLAALFLRTDVLSWVVYYLVPVGSLLVGMLAASGYFAGSRFSGVRINTGTLCLIVALQLMVFFGCEYVQFAPHHYVHRGTRVPVGFFEYLHMKNMSWSTVDSGGQHHELGALGYVFVVLELLAFSILGPVFVAAGVFGSKGTPPTCDLCKVYMKRKRLALFPASLPYRKVTNLPADELAEYRHQQHEHMLAAVKGAEMMLNLAREGDLQTLRMLAGEVRDQQRSIARLPSRMELGLEICPGCNKTVFRTTMITGKRRRRLGQCDVSHEFADFAAAAKV